MIGVGIVGAGSATQAIHLPTLARLSDRFRVRAVTDVDVDLGAAVAASGGAAFTADVASLARRPDVDVVCICSPDRFHAQHVALAMENGANAVLCEKPLGVSDADAHAIARVTARTGVPLIVGTMHAYDPVWRRAWAAAAEAIGSATSIDSRIVLPVNARFEPEGAELLTPASSGAPAGESHGQAVRRRILSLAIHDLPLVRHAALATAADLEVVAATPVQPIGFSVLARAGGTALQVLGSMREHWKPEWSLRVLGADGSLDVRFPPSFVQAGSAEAVLRTSSGTRVFEQTGETGYEAEWAYIGDVLEGTAPPPEIAALTADLAFASSFADQAERLVDAPVVAA